MTHRVLNMHKASWRQSNVPIFLITTMALWQHNGYGRPVAELYISALDSQGTGFPIQGYCVQNYWVAPRLTQPFILLRLNKCVWLLWINFCHCTQKYFWDFINVTNVWWVNNINGDFHNHFLNRYIAIAMRSYVTKLRVLFFI